MRIWTVDACAEKPFAGNPAAVCILEKFPDAFLMQSIAAEMNISETAFVVSVSPDIFQIRWFTPQDEAPICGHATLAAAHVLWEQKLTTSSVLTFESKAGILIVSRNDTWIELDFPVQRLEPCVHVPEALEKAIGVPFKTVYYGQPKFGGHYLVELFSEDAVKALDPDLPLIKQIACRAVCVTARAAAPFDFVSRYFAPSVGLDEDPVCVSAHCRLAPFWAPLLEKHEFLAYNASKRGGTLKVALEEERVIISGKAVTVLEGRLRIK